MLFLLPSTTVDLHCGHLKYISLIPTLRKFLVYSSSNNNNSDTLSLYAVSYNYTVAQSKSPVQDIVGNFVNSCRSHDIQPGFYYSVVTNYYLNVEGGTVQNSYPKPGMANVTQDQYLDIVMAQLDELWGQYGALGKYNN